MEAPAAIVRAKTEWVKGLRVCCEAVFVLDERVRFEITLAFVDVVAALEHA